ncbi:MAG: transposase zinc-binding domain-containing protein, partial [Planctomycetia bacterium]|nr:transposase zinc-binding domain-containing protein [Planctomycetia bacterium]
MHGPLRPAVPGAVRRFLRCGILDSGFARIRCPECGDEFLLAHSCRSRCLCPSCQKKRQVEFGEWVATELMEA